MKAPKDFNKDLCESTGSLYLSDETLKLFNKHIFSYLVFSIAVYEGGGSNTLISYHGEPSGFMLYDGVILADIKKKFNYICENEYGMTYQTTLRLWKEIEANIAMRGDEIWFKDAAIQSPTICSANVDDIHAALSRICDRCKEAKATTNLFFIYVYVYSYIYLKYNCRYHFLHTPNDLYRNGTENIQADLNMSDQMLKRSLEFLNKGGLIYIDSRYHFGGHVSYSRGYATDFSWLRTKNID